MEWATQGGSFLEQVMIKYLKQDISKKSQQILVTVLKSHGEVAGWLSPSQIQHWSFLTPDR